ncbi:hypothetical protein Tco_0516634 [Tanacetum coccineum]
MDTRKFTTKGVGMIALLHWKTVLKKLESASNVSTDVPVIYMQEFWDTVTKHHFSLRFKMNGKSHTVNVDTSEDMLKICPKNPDQKFEDPPFEEEILSFIRDLGHTGEIKVLSDVNVNHLHQPWRLFDAIINKCLSGKTTALEILRLSRAQILWGMYHNKNVDYVYLLWEDLVYQVENKNSKKNNDMDDLMFTTIRVISKHQDTQVYGAILPQYLTNQAMLESKAYKSYRAYATGKKTPKPKSTKKKADSESSPKIKLTQASKGKRIKTSAKKVIPAKKKQSATKLKGLTVLSEVALTEAEQMKIALERSKTQQHSSHASGSGADEGTGVTLGVLDVPSYDYEAEQISWKSSDEEDDDENDGDTDNEDDDDHNDDNANNESDNDQDDDQNDGNDLVHPKLSTFDEKERQDDEDKEEEWFDDEAYDDKNLGANVEGEELDEEETNEEDKANELYRDVNVNLEGRDTEMIDAPRTIVQTTQVIEDTHVIITPVNPEGQQQSSSVSSGFVSNMLNPSPDTGIDSIFNLNTELTSLVDVSVTTIAETLLLSAATLPPPPIPLISHLQQTPVPTPATVPSSSLQDLPNLAVSLIPGIVNTCLANKMNEAVKTVVQLQSDRLRDEAQADNEGFINKLDGNLKKIIKEQVKEQVKAQVSKIFPKIEKTINEQLEAEVLTRSSNESKTSHVVAANLFELELKKILIDKVESNKSIHKSDEQKNLYKALKGPNLINSSTSMSAQAERTTKHADDDLGKNPGIWSSIQDLLNKIGVDDNVHAWSLVELEYFLEEVCKATTDQLDWNNLEGQQYSHDLRKPFPLSPNSRGHDVQLFLVYFTEWFTPRSVLRRHVEDLQLGVKVIKRSSTLQRQDIDGTLNDVRSALDDIMKKNLGWNTCLTTVIEKCRTGRVGS